MLSFYLFLYFQIDFSFKPGGACSNYNIAFYTMQCFLAITREHTGMIELDDLYAFISTVLMQNTRHTINVTQRGRLDRRYEI